MQNITNHARMRSQQRGILTEAMSMVLRFGNACRVRGGESYFMDSTAHQLAKSSSDSNLYRKIADRLNFYVIVGHDGGIVTVAHSNRRRLYTRRKPSYHRSKRQ